MDSYKLRQELSELQKALDETKRQKKILDNLVDDLHKEQLRYLKEIPIYKQQASDAQAAAAEPLKALSELKNKVSVAQKEYDSLQALIIERERRLVELKVEKENLVKDANGITSTLEAKRTLLQERESAVAKREEDCTSKEESHKSVDFSLNKREVAVVNKEKELADKDGDLSKRIDDHNSNVASHSEKVDALIEQKQFLREDQQTLKDKTESLNKLIKDNSDIKAGMLKQSEKMDTEIKKAQLKQDALDKAINDLKNEEKRIKIMELKVMKMVKDAGLEKELKDLMESLK